jgi:beta-1,4-mannooligosaccharide/beta-1,4-mannosyl-N-acetylglucosamine phosphorylase
MKDATRILSRHPSNPIIEVVDHPGFMTVFNPAPAMHKGQTVLLLSMVRFQSRRGGETYVSTSDDGVHFQVEEEPFIRLHEHPYPFSDFGHHVIDNRVTQIDDTYYILTPAKCNYAQSPITVLGKTTDFKHYEPIEIIDYPKVRGTSLFPGKIGGKYYKLIRPGAGTGSHGEIWISSSPDLVNWGSYRPFLTPGYCPFWNSQKIGPTPPIKTSHGWLEIVHGVSTPCDGAHYYIGAVLMDLDQPWKIIGKTYSYLLAPETPYERNGQVGNVVFPCGALADEDKDELRLYYGSADTCIGLATGKLSEVIQACLDEI